MIIDWQSASSSAGNENELKAPQERDLPFA